MILFYWAFTFWNAECNFPLGMTSGRIEDSQITASDHMRKIFRLFYKSHNEIRLKGFYLSIVWKLWSYTLEEGSCFSMCRLLGAKPGEAGPDWYHQCLDGKKLQVVVTGSIFNAKSDQNKFSHGISSSFSNANVTRWMCVFRLIFGVPPCCTVCKHREWDPYWRITSSHCSPSPTAWIRRPGPPTEETAPQTPWFVHKSVYSYRSVLKNVVLSHSRDWN